MNVLSCDVGNVSLLPVRFSIKDDTALFSLAAIPVPLCAEKHAKFERHVETRKGWIPIRFGARDIIHAVAALIDNREYLREPILSGVIGFERASSSETRPYHRENDGVEDWLVFCIERAVYEDVTARCSRHSVLCGTAPTHKVA
jgi:predicted membrane chloride channel (bestrophin family)